MKKVIFGFIATVFMGVLSVNAQKTLDVDILLGYGYDHYNNCTAPGGICISPKGGSANLTATLAKVNENTIALNLTQDFYKENERLLKNGLNIETVSPLRKELIEKLNLQEGFKIAKGTYEGRLIKDVWVFHLSKERE